MASKIILKKSSVAEKVPVAGDLDFGELALNYTDGKLYYKKSDGTTIDYFSAGNSGGSTFTVADTVPPTASSGDQWLDTNTGVKYTYVNDGTSNQWIELESLLSISQGSSSATSIYSNEYVFSGTSVNSTETEIFANGEINSRIAVPADVFLYYTADIVCKRTDSPDDFAAFYLKGACVNTSGVVSDVGSLYEVIVTRTDPNILVDIRTDDATNTLNIYVSGAEGKTFSWKATITTVEV